MTGCKEPRDAVHPLLLGELQGNGSWGVYQGGLLRDNRSGRCRRSASSREECIPGGTLAGLRPEQASHLLLHQVQGQGGPVRQGRRRKDVFLAALPSQTLEVEGRPPVGWEGEAQGTWWCESCLDNVTQESGPFPEAFSQEPRQKQAVCLIQEK